MRGEVRLLSAKSEELSGLREGEPVDGAPASGGSGGPGGSGASAGSVGSGDGGAADAVAQDVAEETARAVAEASGEDAGSGSGFGSSAGKGPGSGVDAKPTGGSGGSDGSGDSGSSAGSDGSGGSGAGAGANDQVGVAAHTGTDFRADPDADTKPFPAPREHHTPLYGRGKRILPWKHKARLAPGQRRRRKIVVGSLWGCVLVVCGTVGWSVAGALTSPGTDTVQARLAEWGRDHGLGGVVSTLEQWQYDLNPPKKGGSVDTRQFSDLGPTQAPSGAATPAKPLKSGSAPGSKPGGTVTPAPDVIAMQPRMPAPAGLTLESGEGVFQVGVQTPDGQPVVQVARVRPDAEYTDVAADILWIDQKHSRYVLHPGHEGDLNKTVTTVPNQIDSNARPGLIALFNGGFKISESHGGYYDHGITAAPLVDGAASEVIFKDGHMSVGAWGRDYSMQKNPEIVSVRQNLRLMVDNGQVVPYINDSATWGRADHGSAAVWRSGVGVTATGDIVWVGGNKLTAPSLARLLKDAGAIRGMQLDINLRWADFQYFPGRDGNPDNSKLYEDFLQGANKFFVNSTKDFMAVYLR
jgi:hypothetical protein